MKKIKIKNYAGQQLYIKYEIASKYIKKYLLSREFLFAYRVCVYKKRKNKNKVGLFSLGEQNEHWQSL